MMYHGPQIKKFQEGLLAAFDLPGLRMFMFLVMNRRLDDVALGNDLPEIMFNVLMKANTEGWVDELIRNAAVERSNNAKLQAAAAIVPPAAPPTPVLPVASAKAGPLEKIVKEQSHFTDVEAFLNQFQRICTGVCRVDVPGSGGTGFLVAPDLVITNFHVVERVIQGLLPVQTVSCTFGYRREAGVGTVTPGEFFAVDPGWQPIFRPYSQNDLVDPPLPPLGNELDYAILRLQRPAAQSAMAQAAGGERGYFRLAEAVALAAGEPVFILQHPQQALNQPQLPLQMAIGKTLPCDWPAFRLRHDASTLGGSSGSPCFNSDLQLCALHHSGDPASKLARFNQAVPLQAIIADLAARLPEFAQRGVAPFWTMPV